MTRPSLGRVSRPLLSIVTPCLNSAATIGETLDSVRAQGLEEVVEHVVVDGGSSDGTVALLEAAGVRFISEPDRGLSDAMNKGLALATGHHVGWLNADDYYLEGALARVLAALAEQPDALWITGPCLIVDAEGNEIRRGVTRYKQALLRHHRLGSLLVQNYIAAPSTFMHRESVVELGGFDERFRYSMDYDLWLRLAAQEPPVVVEQPLTAFRMAGESLSMSGFETQFAEHAQNAREHGAGHPLPVAANRLISRLIVVVYRALRALRERRSR